MDSGEPTMEMRVALCKALVVCLDGTDQEGHRPWLQKLLKCSRNVPVGGAWQHLDMVRVLSHMLLHLGYT